MAHTVNRTQTLCRSWRVAILFLFIPLVSCVYDTQLEYLNDQVVALNRKVSNLEEKMDKQMGDDKLSTIRSNQAAMGADLDQIKGDVKQISGRVQDNEHIIKRTVERDLGEQDGMKENLDDLSRKVIRLERLLAHQQEYLGLEPPPDLEPKPEITPVTPDQGEKPPATAPEEEKKTEGPAGETKSSDLQAYDRALELYREGKYEDAIDGFKAFLRKYPKSDRADNAQFWVAECHMNLKQYEQAILSYQEVIKKYPKGNKVPNALLRQAMAFLEIKDKTSSRLLLKKIIKKYPRSSEAKIAEKKLATLK
jgi:tol-pal system protein YbgF